MASVTRILKAMIPSPLTLVMLAAWLCLSLLTSHILGTYLVARIDSPNKVVAITFALTIILPIFIAPRPTWEPTGWGIAINVLALLAMGLFAEATVQSVENYGDWTIHWAKQRNLPPSVVKGAETLTEYSRWLIARVPMDQIEAHFGFSEADMSIKLDKPTDDALKKVVGEATGSGSGIDPFGDLTKQVKDQIEKGQDEKYQKDQIHAPDYKTRMAMERRLREVVNLERTRRGLPSLMTREDLSRVAVEHAEAMRNLGFFSHTDPQGHGPRDRAEIALLTNTEVTELIGKTEYASDVPRELVNNFMKNAEDRGNLLGDEDEYQAMGVGIACDGPVCFATILFQ